MHDYDRGDLAPKTKVTVGRKKYLCVNCLQDCREAVLEPKIPEDGMSCRREYHDRVDIGAKNKPRIIRAVKDKEELVLRIGGGPTPAYFVGVPSQAFESARK
jgi:hypothetical protein